MMMTSPAAGDPIELHIACLGVASLELDQGSQKIGSGLAVPESRVQDMDPATILSRQLIPQESLMAPNLLHPQLGR